MPGRVAACCACTARRASATSQPGWQTAPEPRVQRESGAGSSQSPSAACSVKTRYTVARLTPSALAIVLAGSPLACIRMAKAAFFSSSALGRPMDCPRARRASRAAARRCPPLAELSISLQRRGSVGVLRGHCLRTGQKQRPGKRSLANDEARGFCWSVKDIQAPSAYQLLAFMQVKHSAYRSLVRDYLD
jgi:hypothetical protein